MSELLYLLFSSTYKQHKWKKTKLTGIKMEVSIVQLERNLAINFEPPEKGKKSAEVTALTSIRLQAFLLKIPDEKQSVEMNVV